jgi:hypothetical protein
MTLETKLMHAMYQLLQKIPHETTHGQAREKSAWCRKDCLACEWEETKRFYSGKTDGTTT